MRSEHYTSDAPSRRLRVGAAAIVSAALAIVASSVFAKDYGKPGQPVHLVIGYQPYYTQAWSAVIQKEMKPWEKHLPKGSTVEWQIGLQGAIIGNNMLADKNDIGYMGDMPSIVAVSKKQIRDLRIVAVLGLANDQCSVFLSRVDAPKFSSPVEAVKWWSGKRVAVAKGSCTDRSGQETMRKFGIKPEQYLNQNIEVQTSNFKAGRIDGSIMWEPTASKMVLEGIAQRVADTKLIGKLDGGFMAMQGELIKQRPDVAKAWLEAELDANLFWAKPENYMKVVEMAHKNTQGFSKEALWMSMAGKYPAIQGGGDVRNIMYYGFNDEVFNMIKDATAFLHEIKSVAVEQLPKESVMPEFTSEILKRRGLSVPLAKIVAQPPESYPGGKINLPATWRQ
ncbi:MAG: nitrate ABC transporter substrate-binding protein [Betaproteobacteria bacterium]|nr:MAG: nitrate ABC transporter substrate-binding protein [Betaproteobacteria bacterium]